MHKIIKITVVLAMLLTLSSCWTPIEISRLAIVMGIGIDVGENEGEYTVTAQIAKPRDLKFNSSGDSEAYFNLKSSGNDIQTQLRDIDNELSRMLYTGHMEMILISEDAAKQGLITILDYFYRSVKSRFNIPIVITKGKRAVIVFCQYACRHFVHVYFCRSH